MTDEKPAEKEPLTGEEIEKLAAVIIFRLRWWIVATLLGVGAAILSTYSALFDYAAKQVIAEATTRSNIAVERAIGEARQRADTARVGMDQVLVSVGEAKAQAKELTDRVATLTTQAAALDKADWPKVGALADLFAKSPDAKAVADLVAGASQRMDALERRLPNIPNIIASETKNDVGATQIRMSRFLVPAGQKALLIVSASAAGSDNSTSDKSITLSISQGPADSVKQCGRSRSFMPSSPNTMVSVSTSCVATLGPGVHDVIAERVNAFSTERQEFSVSLVAVAFGSLPP